MASRSCGSNVGFRPREEKHLDADTILKKNIYLYIHLVFKCSIATALNSASSPSIGSALASREGKAGHGKGGLHPPIVHLSTSYSDIMRFRLLTSSPHLSSLSPLSSANHLPAFSVAKTLEGGCVLVQNRFFHGLVQSWGIAVGFTPHDTLSSPTSRPPILSPSLSFSLSFAPSPPT